MNTKILQKCLDELGKETPRLDYVRGMLETLVDMEGGVTVTADGPRFSYTTAKDLLGKADEVLTDEDKEYARKMAQGPFGNIG